jgi:HK97 family phage portal protein
VIAQDHSEIRGLWPGMSTSTNPLPPIRYVDDSVLASMDVERALSVTAIFACVRFLAESIAAMPMHLYRRAGDNRERDTSNPLYRTLCVAPNPDQSYYEWMEQLVYQVALYGNHYSLIVPGEQGFATELRPLHPSRVQPGRLVDGTVIYDCVNRDGVRRYSSSQIFHVRGLSDDGLVGMMPAELCRVSVNIARQLDTSAMAFWENNARPNVLLETSETIEAGAMDKLRRSWREVFGGPKNVGQAAVLPNGVTAKIFDAASREGSQYMELRNAVVTEIARAFRIGPTMIGQLDHGTYSNVEQESLNAQKFTLTPWQRRIEGAVRRSLLVTYPDHYVQIDSRGLLRGDSAARAAYFNTLFQLGAMSPNDIRRVEDFDPIVDPAADEYFVQLNMAPLSNFGQVEAEATADGEESAAPAEPLNGAQIASLLDILANVSAGLLTKAGAAAIIQASFPSLSKSQIDGMVAGVVEGVAVAATQAKPQQQDQQQEEPADGSGT